MKSIGNQQSAIGNALKSAPRQKPTETAFWPLRIFCARMSAKTGVRVFAMEKNQNAKGIRLVASGQTSEIRSQPTFDLRSLISGARIWFYGLALRVKRCPISFCPPNHKSAIINHQLPRANPAKGFGGPAEKYGRMAV